MLLEWLNSPSKSSLVVNNKNTTPNVSQKKKRKSNCIIGPSSLDEENKLNVSTNLASNSFEPVKKNKSPKIEVRSHKKENKNKMMLDCNTNPTIDTGGGNPKSSFHFDTSPNASECGTDISVSERREWLKNFEKKQASNVFRSMDKEKKETNDDRSNIETRFVDNKEGREPPPALPRASAPAVLLSQNIRPVFGSAKKTKKPRPIVNRRASSVSAPSWVAQKKVEVKATDDGYASVASLSKWLENDPTSAKKKRHIRRGRNILTKSRQFEQEDENVVIMDAHISRGAVGDKKKWLQNAFQSTIEEEDDTCSTFSGYVKSDVGRSVRSYPRFNRQGAQTEIITDDAASSLSVADKKDWLKKAFVKNSEERTKLGYNSKAHTDVMHSRGQPRDEAVSRAKLRFKERSARKLQGATPTRPSGKPAPSSFLANSNVGATRAALVNNVSISSEEGSSNSADTVSSKSTDAVEIEEDNTPVDFRAARDALVQRSKKNGHDTQVVNKVYLRKKKFEKLEDESRRKSLCTGLVLKPSWELPDDSKGLPSTAYEKKYVPANDIAKKRSFDELP